MPLMKKLLIVLCCTALLAWGCRKQKEEPLKNLTKEEFTAQVIAGLGC